MWFLTLRSGFYSVVLHAAVLTLLVVNFNAPRPPVFKPRPPENIVEAVKVDDKEVEKELQRLRDLEKAKEQALENKLKAIERKANETEKKRQAEERRLAAAREKAAAEKKKREQARLEEEKKAAAERQRIADEKAQAQAELKRIEEKKQKAEAERKRLEEEKRKAEAERKRLAEEQRKKEEAKALQQQLAREQRELEQAQRQQTLQKLTWEISRKVSGNFNKVGLPQGLTCRLAVQAIPGGEVISVTLSESSGNEIFDRRAITAVEKASPLPLPADPALFDRLQLRNFLFTFAPE